MTRVVAAGDSALVLEFDERIDQAINARVMAAAACVSRERLAGVRDIVPAYRSVTVYFDPLRVRHDRLLRLLEEAGRAAPGDAPPPRAITLPVCYGGDLGPDLAEVSAFAGLHEDEVVASHAGRPYRVFMLGFVPGFAYLGVVDDRIAAPRRAVPRTKVPAGSVGIAGSQTGVYPCETPGGWQLIGRTPITMFDSHREPPALVAPGDTVRFEPIDRRTFDRFGRGGR